MLERDLICRQLKLSFLKQKSERLIDFDNCKIVLLSKMIYFRKIFKNIRYQGGMAKNRRQHLEVVTNTFRLQHPSSTSAAEF